MYNVYNDYDRPMRGEQPFFTDTLENLQSDDPTIGVNGVEWHGTLYPYLYSNKERLIYRFNQKYHFREIGCETVSRWMWQLQDRFDSIADKYDHAYKLYSLEADDKKLIDDLGIGYTRTLHYQNGGTGNSSNSSSATGNSKFRDTPTSSDSTINNPTTENVDTSSSSGSSSSSRQNQGDSTEKYEYNDEHKLEEINKMIEKYKQLDEDFINEFAQMFIGITTILE